MGDGLFYTLYHRLMYGSALKMSFTEWLRQDLLREPLVYLAAVFVIGLWLGLLTRGKVTAGLTLAVIVAVLIGHVWGAGG
mgnify:CR=1 FL=1